MLIKKPSDIPSREITDHSVYLNRRTLLRGGILAASVVATGGLYRWLNHSSAPSLNQVALKDVKAPTPADMSKGFYTNESKTPLDQIASYNNFYEFSTSKGGVASEAAGFVTSPWKIKVDGLCAKPRTFDLDDLRKLGPPEERVYRMRCVEAWSMVIPWDGIPLSRLIEQVEPLAAARFVGFETLFDPKQMPNQNASVLPWPYVEGLRMDEAMHPLAILATGIYGLALPPQDGAPVRLVTPWKYGFKGIKSIVKITLAATQPKTTWNLEAPDEYGFYANVNPQVDHPRWSQKMENRLGEGERPTLLFNGYADLVGHLYAGMDLRANF
jgi:sulfoxide reductase catalytic subunit YedY